MTRENQGKVVPTITTIVGSLGIIAALLSAFGLDLTEEQLTAIIGLSGLLTTLAGLWFSPGVPVGVVEAKPEEPSTSRA